MSLIYGEDSDIAEKDEEINIDKSDNFSKEKDSLKINKKKSKKDIKSDEYEDLLDQEALMNIPTKSLSIKNKKSKNNSKVNLKEIYDTSLEGVEIPLLNNNINNGSLMLTELLDLENNNNSENKSKSKTTLNLVDESEKEKIEKNNSFLKRKLDNINMPISLKKYINSGIEKTHDKIHDDFRKDRLNISKKNVSVNELLSLNKSHRSYSNIFLTRVERISKENIKRLKNLKLEEQHIKKNIAKINQNKKLIEEGLPLKNNIVDLNIRKSQLKNISKIKDDLVSKLAKINEKIDILLKEEKLKKIKHYDNYLEDEQEQYNLHLKQLQIEQNKQREKFNDDLKLANEKKQKNLDKKEKELNEKKNLFLKKIKDKDRKMFLKRKKETDLILEKTKKYIKEKFSKKYNEYLFFQFKEKFEKNEKKLIDKVNMMKKDSLVTQKEILELDRKIKEQKKLLLEDAEEKKKQLLKLWSFRSQTLPVYKHPLSIQLEEEHIQKVEKEEEEKKKKECNDLEKRNYKPPKVIINKKLKIQREIRKDKTDKESVLRTELNNKKKLDKLKFTPVSSPKHLKIIHELSQELNNNKYIDYNELKNLINKKNKKILKPIKILHPKPDKPIDYLTQMILEKSKNKNQVKEKEKEKNNELNINKIFHKNKEIGVNIIESIKMAKAQTEAIDNKVIQKKQILHLNGGYLNNPQLGDEVGDLLIESIQTKLGIMNKLSGE